MSELILLGDVPAINAERLGKDRWAVRHGDEVLSWGELAERSLRRAHALSKTGVKKDDFVVLALPNCNELYEWTFAIWKLGATPMMVSSRLPKQELNAVIDTAGARYIIAHDPEIVASTDAWAVDFGREFPDTTELVSQAATHWKAMTSGGSTGRPKVIVDNSPACFPVDLALLDIPKDGVVLNPAPLYHNFPFALSHMAMLRGCSVVGMPKFDAETALSLIDQYQVQWVNMVPTMMNRIARLPADVRNQYDVSSLQTLWHTAAPIPPWLKEFWINWIGGERIWEMYGGTEAFCSTQLNGIEWLEHRGSVGRPRQGEIRILGEHGEVLPTGEVGEIYMRGPDTSTSNYHYLGAESRRIGEGFESFGDYGWLDEGGYLYVADRRADLILCGGANIYPAEIESVLMELPSVVTAIVIGLPDDDMGAVPHAILELEAGAEQPSVDMLRSFVEERLVRYKVPRSFEFTSEPLRDEAGKVRRNRLRAERIKQTGSTSA